MSTTRQIQGADFLGQLTPAARQRLHEMSHVRRYARHQLIFRPGSPGENIYILQQGRIKIFSLSPAGRSAIMWFCFPGDLFGLTELARPRAREVYAEACSDIEVLAISNQLFKQFLVQHPETTLLIIDLLSCRLRGLGSMMLNLTSDDVQTRLVKLIVRLAARYGKPIPPKSILLDVPLTHQEIAEMIGTSRQTVTSLLGQLKRSGLIDMPNHSIQIADHEQLQNIVTDLFDADALLQASHNPA